MCVFIVLWGVYKVDYFDVADDVVKKILDKTPWPLYSIHWQGIVHKDVRRSNMLITLPCIVYVCPF